MADLSPSQILTTAAQALRDAANATRYEMKTGTYWHGLAPDVAWERGITNAVGGPAGDFCALMSPDAALALADWLEATASEMGVVDGTEYRAVGDGHDFASWNAALALARQLLGGES